MIAKWLSRGGIAPTRLGSDISINELILLFWKHVEKFYRRPDGSPSPEQDNFRQALRPLRSIYGSTIAAEFGPRALRAVIQRMIQLNWSRNYINKQVSRIKHIFRWAVIEELIPSATHQAIALVPGLRRGKTDARESEPVKSVPESHIEAAKEFLSPLIQDMVELQLLTGMRSGELVIMRGIDIDTSGTVWMYRPQYHKTSITGSRERSGLVPRRRNLSESTGSRIWPASYSVPRTRKHGAMLDLNAAPVAKEALQAIDEFLAVQPALQREFDEMRSIPGGWKLTGNYDGSTTRVSLFGLSQEGHARTWASCP